MMGVVWGLVVATAVTSGITVDVTELDGRTASGQLISLTHEQVLVETSTGPQTFAARQLLSLAPRANSGLQELPLVSPIKVELVDGSTLLASAYRVAAGRASVETGLGPLPPIPTRAIRAVRLKQQNTDLQQQWRQIAAGESTADVLVHRKMQQTTDANGTEHTTIALDSLEGALLDVNDTQVSFEFEGTRVDVPIEKVEGLLYLQRGESSAGEPVCRLVDRGGSAWELKSLTLEGESLQGVSVGGVRVSLPVEKLTKVDYSVGNLVYLSDLKPESIDWLPLIRSPSTPPSLARMFQPQLDRGFYGGPLMLENVSYAKGLAVHSRTTLNYRLTREFQKLAVLAGIDDRFRSEGHATLKVLGDGRELLSKELIGGEPPTEIDVDVRGVRRLTVLVDFGADRSDVGDYVNLCNARLLK